MKKVIFTCLVIFIGLAPKAQHTLSFNQALLVDGTTATVQANHVWKIVGVYYSTVIPDPLCTSSTSCSSVSPLADVITINGTNTTIRSVKSRGSTNIGVATYMWEQSFPLWLPAGATLASGAGVTGISVLDFVVN